MNKKLRNNQKPWNHVESWGSTATVIEQIHSHMCNPRPLQTSFIWFNTILLKKKRHHCHALLFILFYLPTYSPLSPLPWSSISFYSEVSFPCARTLSPSFQSTISPHTATSQQTNITLAALHLPCPCGLPSLSPEEALPPALQLAGLHGEPWPSLRNGDSSQALGQLLRKRKDRSCLCSSYLKKIN